MTTKIDGWEKWRTQGDGREGIINKMTVGRLCLHRMNFGRLCLGGWEIMITKGEGWVTFGDYNNAM